MKKISKLLTILFILFLFNLCLIHAVNSLDDTSSPTETTVQKNPTTTNPTTTTPKTGTDIQTDDKGKLTPVTIKVSDVNGRNFVAGGIEFNAPKDSQIVINENEKTIKVSVPAGSQIKQQPTKKKKNQETDETRDIEYRALDFIQLPDEVAQQMGFAGKKVEFKGILNSNGNNWYIPSGQQMNLKIDGKESLLIRNINGKVGNVNEKINLYFKQGQFERNYIFFGDKKFITGSTNNLDGSPIQFLEGNPYAKMNKDSHLTVQSLSNSEIRIENNKVIMAGGGIMNQDEHAYMMSSKKQELYWKKGSGIFGIDSAQLKGKINSPDLEFLPYKKDGTPVSPYAQKILFDDKTGSKVIPMTQAESRLKINQPDRTIPPVIPVKPDTDNYGIEPPPDYKIYQGPETSYRTKNFYVISSNGNAKMYAAALEYNRYKNAMEWIGKPLADWNQPAVVTMQLSNRGNGGATTFQFGQFGTGGKPQGYRMNIQGTPDGLLSDVIPHETMHMITADAFQQPTPRWIDEGIATTTETTNEQQKHKMMLSQFMQQRRIMDFSSVMGMKEYPSDMLSIYAQGNSLSNFLIEKGGGGISGKRTLFQAFSYANQNGWPASLKKYYGFSDTRQFQNEWLQNLAAKVIAVLTKILKNYPNVNSILIFIDF